MKDETPSSSTVQNTEERPLLIDTTCTAFTVEFDESAYSYSAK